MHFLIRHLAEQPRRSLLPPRALSLIHDSAAPRLLPPRGAAPPPSASATRPAPLPTPLHRSSLPNAAPLPPHGTAVVAFPPYAAAVASLPPPWRGRLFPQAAVQRAGGGAPPGGGSGGDASPGGRSSYSTARYGGGALPRGESGGRATGSGGGAPLAAWRHGLPLSPLVWRPPSSLSPPVRRRRHLGLGRRWRGLVQISVVTASCEDRIGGCGIVATGSATAI